MRDRLAGEYNKVVKKAKDIIDLVDSKNAATAAKANAQLKDQFPKVKKEAGFWVVEAKSKTYRVQKINWDDPDLTGLRSPDDPSKMNCVKRPSEAPGESC